jgi:RNA polymerase sigma-70 factor (ECF subfamily)
MTGGNDQRPSPCENGGGQSGAACVETDESLIARSRSGDGQAVRQLVERHLTTAYRIAYRIVGTRAEAEDIAQDVLVRVLDYKSGWFSSAGFQAWLRRAIINRTIDVHRRRWWTLAELHENLPDVTRETQENTLLASEVERRVAQAVLGLPFRQRAAITLCFYENLSLADAAAAMDTTPGAVESLLHRAKAALRTALGDMIHEKGGPNVRRT